MGAGMEMVCRTCRKRYYIGYGSYGNRPGGRTLNEAVELPERCWGRKAYIQFMQEHEDHDFLQNSEDWEYLERTATYTLWVLTGAVEKC